jgi:hypothetical protein
VTNPLSLAAGGDGAWTALTRRGQSPVRKVFFETILGPC